MITNLASKRFYIYEYELKISYKTRKILNGLENLVRSYYSSESYQALRHKLNNSEEYYLFRRYCLTRDNYWCQCCSETYATQVHHITEINVNPRMALDPYNGISLCNDCHTMQHKWLTDAVFNHVE